MKKTLFLLLTIAFSIVKIDAQDVIYKNNGDSIVAKITKITDAEIGYVYEGEDLVNNINIDELYKVKYSSGRIQRFPYTKQINNVNLKIEDFIKVFNHTTEEIKLTIIGIHKDNGVKIALPQVTIPAKAQEMSLDIGVKNGRLDHFISFILKAECENRVEIIGESHFNDLFVYFYPSIKGEKASKEEKNAFAIDAQDVIYKSNGDSIVAKITKITDTEIGYVYEGEDLVNNINIDELYKVKYSSGRIQRFPYTKQINNVNLKIEDFIKVFNHTTEEIKLTIIGIHKDDGVKVALPQVTIPAKAQEMILDILDIGVKNGRLDHFLSFILKAECENDIEIIGESHYNDLFVYFYPSIKGEKKSFIYENNGEFRDNVKVYNHTPYVLKISSYAIINGEKRSIADSRELPPREEDYQIRTKVKNREVRQFIFETEGVNTMPKYVYAQSDDLYVIFE